MKKSLLPSLHSLEGLRKIFVMTGSVAKKQRQGFETNLATGRKLSFSCLKTVVSYIEISHLYQDFIAYVA